VSVIFALLFFQTWLVWRNLQEWTWARESQIAISSRIAQDRQALAAFQVRFGNELRLQTFSRALPDDEQRLMLPILFNRLDADAQQLLLSIKLRSLNVIGEQQAPNIIYRDRR